MKQKWFIPCNPSVYNVISHFRERDEIAWKQTADMMREGDDAYLYISNPIGLLKFRCEIIQTMLGPELIKEHEYAIQGGASTKQKYMLLRLSHVFSAEELTSTYLKEHGLGQLQRQARIFQPLSDILDALENRK